MVVAIPCPCRVDCAAHLNDSIWKAKDLVRLSVRLFTTLVLTGRSSFGNN